MMPFVGGLVGAAIYEFVHTWPQGKRKKRIRKKFDRVRMAMTEESGRPLPGAPGGQPVIP